MRSTFLWIDEYNLQPTYVDLEFTPKMASSTLLLEFK